MNRQTLPPEDATLTTCVIPENFIDTGRCFNGMFRTRNLIEGAIVAAPIAHILTKVPLPLNQKIVLTVVLAGGLLMAFICGINGDSITEFIVNIVAYSKKKRVAKYNPRVKSEATPGYLTKELAELPRDKIIRIFTELNKSELAVEEPVSRDIYDPMYQEFFADDMGFVDTPDDLKSKSELRKEAKSNKRKEKAVIAKEKRAAKLSAKKDKKDKKNKRGEP